MCLKSKYKIYRVTEGYRYDKRELILESTSRQLAKTIAEGIRSKDGLVWGEYEWAGFEFSLEH